jgi:hypothetical protein
LWNTKIVDRGKEVGDFSCASQGIRWCGKKCKVFFSLDPTCLQLLYVKFCKSWKVSTYVTLTFFTSYNGIYCIGRVGENFHIPDYATLLGTIQTMMETLWCSINGIYFVNGTLLLKYIILGALFFHLFLLWKLHIMVL